MEFHLCWWHTFELQSGNITNIVVTRSNAVVISVADVYFDILSLLVVQRAHALRLIKGGLISLAVLEGQRCGVAASEPRVRLIAEGVQHFHLVVVGVSDEHYVLFGDEVDA